MKKIIFILLSLVSFAGYGQKIINVSADRSISTDTMNAFTVIYINPTANNKRVTISNITNAVAKTVTFVNIGSYKCLIGGKDTLSVGRDIVYQWARNAYKSGSPDLTKYLAIYGDTLEGDLFVSANTEIRNISDPGQLLRIGASDYQLEANSDIEVTSQQDVKLTGGSGINSLVQTAEIFIESTTGHDDYLNSDGWAALVAGLTTSYYGRISVDTSNVVIKSYNASFLDGKSIIVKRDSIKLLGDSDTPLISITDSLTKISTPGGLAISDGITKIGATTNDSIGHFGYGYIADLSVKDGARIESSTGESVFINTTSYSAHTDQTLWKNNVICLWNRAKLNNKSVFPSAARFLDSTGGEVGAVGFQPRTANSFYDLNNMVFLAASMPYKPGQTSGVQPCKLGLVQEGDYLGSFKTISRILCDTNWTISLRDPNGNRYLSFNALGDATYTRAWTSSSTHQATTITATSSFRSPIYTLPQSAIFRSFNTSDETTNTERVTGSWSGNVFSFASSATGTGTLRSISLSGNSRSILLAPGGGANSEFIRLDMGSTTGGANTIGTLNTGTFNTSSGTNSGNAITLSITQSGTAGYRGNWISIFESSVGSGVRDLFDYGVNTAANGSGTHTSRLRLHADGRLVLGTTFSSALFTMISTTEQLRSGYDASNYWNAITSSTGITTFDAVGSNTAFVFSDPTYFNSTLATNTNQDNANFAVFGTGVLNASSEATLLFSNASSIRRRISFRGNTQTTLTANDYYAGLIIGGMGYTEAATGTHPHSVGVVIKPPIITNGAGATDTVSTVLITGASTTGNLNYALNVAGGNLYFKGKIIQDQTITAGGTTGDRTINKPTGTVNIASSGTTVTVTNSLVTTSSIIYAVVRTNDTTAKIKNVVPGSGSFVINMDGAVTAETSIGFIVFD